MSLRIDDYVNMLLSSEVSISELEKVKEILSSSKELETILNSPTVSSKEKEAIIEEIFPLSVRTFMRSLSQECATGSLKEITAAYIEAADRKNKVAKVKIYCVTEPDDKQLKGIEEFVCREEKTNSAEIEIVKDESLIGGFVIEVGNKRYDRSLKSKIAQIKEKIVVA